jgi:7-cyano-7-deazaguanine synthase in queuosine biosynthesis
MLITDISVVEHETHTEVSGVVGVFPLWFKFSRGHEINKEDATPFLLAAITHGMLLGEDLIIDDRYYVSERVFNELPQIQTIINCWNPIFKRINVRARTTAALPEKKGCAAFFSGGVDSLYTLVKHQDEITHLILINGFDFNVDPTAWQIMVKRNEEIAAIFNKKLTVVETNLKEFDSWFRLTRFACFGAILAATGQLLDFKKVHINSADTYEKIFARGSHPLLEPLFSTEVCDIVHTGLEADRAGKIGLIKEHPAALNRLWVCTKDPKANCGQCDKCIRTFIALKLNDVHDFKFTNPVKISDINKITIDSEINLTFFEKFRSLAIEKGYMDIERELRKLIFKYKTKVFLKDVDTYLFNSAFQNWKRSRQDPQAELKDIFVLPRYTDEMMLQELKKSISSNPRFKSSVAIGSVFK